ncbi:transposase [Novipirellula galeiformis]
MAEGINRKIQSVKRRGGGYRNKENCKTAIFSTAVDLIYTHTEP